MTEVEQLRKEVNELRERLVQLEYRINPIGPGVFHQPIFTGQPAGDPYQPPFVVTCTSEK